MAQVGSFEISDIRIHEESEEFLMDIDVIGNTTEYIKKTTFIDVPLFSRNVADTEIVKTDYSLFGNPEKGYIKFSDGVLRQFKNMDIKIFEKHRPEISIEEAERLLKCKIVRN